MGDQEATKGFDIFGTGAILQELRLETALETEILDVLKDLRGLVNRLVPKPAVRIRLYRFVQGQFVEVTAMGFQLQDVQSVPLSITFVDADGNPTPAPAGLVPVWASSDLSKIAVTPAADGLTAVARGTGGLGDAQVNVTAGALAGQWPVTLVAGPPASITITPGTPTP